MILIRVAMFAAGVAIVLGVIISAVRSFVLARSARDTLTALVFRTSRRLFNFFNLRRAQSYADRDRVLALYAPLTLLILPVIWLILVWLGYALIYLAVGVNSLRQALILSGSSLLTLGFANENALGIMLIEFSEAVVGLILIAILIAYLPTMYAAFSSREKQVTMLEVRAGSPPSAVEMLIRAYGIKGLEYLGELFIVWEEWFAEVEETHTSLAPLVFFRSTKPERSWVTAAGAVLDCAAIYASTLDVKRNPQADLCIRSGYLCLRYIADFFNIEYDPDPHFPAHPISISQQEFDEVYDELLAEGLPLKPDRNQCWHDFAGWRVNYDTVLLRLAAITMAPYAPWSSDRSLPGMLHKS